MTTEKSTKAGGRAGVTDTLIELMEGGGLPWRSRWSLASSWTRLGSDADPALGLRRQAMKFDVGMAAETPMPTHTNLSRS
jgi:hypothetical protein